MLRIPLPLQSDPSTQKYLELHPGRLPSDVAKLVFIFQRERVSIGYWLQAAIMYHRENKTQELYQILNEALQDTPKQQNPHLFESQKDRINAYNALASYYLQESEHEATQEKQDKMTELGRNYINSADSENLTAPETWITKSFFFIQQGNVRNASQYLDHFNQIGYQHPLVQLIQGLIEFNKGQYQECLKNLKLALQANPRCPPQIRFGIGLCYYRLGNMAKARFAFQKVIELDPENDMAMVALAIVELQTQFGDQDIRNKILLLLEHAFQLNDSNTLAMKFLANHYVINKEYEIAQKLCEHGLQLLEKYRRPEQTIKDNPHFRKDLECLKSDFHFILGKIQHIQENYQEALNAYTKAVKLNSQNYPAQFCLGKVHYSFSNFQEADTCFNTVLSVQQHKDCYEALKLLAQTKAKQNKTEESTQLFKRVLELNPKDAEANIEIAQMFEVSEPKTALVYYENGLRIMQHGIETRPSEDPATDILPPELLLNVGVLRLEVGKAQEAYDSFQAAIKNCEKVLKLKPEDQRTLAIRVTAKFNLACWYEQHHRYGEANEYYKSIIKDQPTYVDAYLRLAYLARNRGDIKRALEYIEDAKKQQARLPEEFGKPINACCLKGKILTDIKELKEAYLEFSFVVDKLLRSDSYALIGKANINYEFSTKVRRDPQQQEFYLKKAMDTYIAILEYEESNAFAALGIANVLAEHAKLAESMEIYKVLRETNPNLPHPLINLAHLHMAQENYEVAVNLYKKALDKYPNGMDLEVELYLSKAYFKQKSYEQCKKLLNSLIMRYPQDLRLKFNMVLCLTQQTNETFNADYRKVSETQDATRQLQYSQKLLTFILYQRDKFSQYYQSNVTEEVMKEEREAMEHMLKVCDEKLGEVREMLQQSTAYLEFDQKRERELQDQEQQKVEKIRSIQQMAEQERESKMAEQRKKEEEEQQKAEENAKQVASLALDALNEKLSRKKGEKKVTTMNMDEDGFIAQDMSQSKEGEYGSEVASPQIYSEDEEYKGGVENEEEKEKVEKKKKDKKDKKRKKDKKEKKDKKKKKSKKHRKEGEDEVMEGAEGEEKKPRRLKKLRALEDEDAQEDVAMKEEAPVQDEAPKDETPKE